MKEIDTDTGNIDEAAWIGTWFIFDHNWFILDHTGFILDHTWFILIQTKLLWMKIEVPTMVTVMYFKRLKCRWKLCEEKCNIYFFLSSFYYFLDFCKQTKNERCFFFPISPFLDWNFSLADMTYSFQKLPCHREPFLKAMLSAIFSLW